MTFVLGRDEDAADDRPAGHIGQYRARDGSHGEALHLDLDGPHAALIVGKRGYGKSYTLGVIVEELARTTGVAPVVIDPMGVFTTLAAENDGDTIPATVEPQPAVDPATLDPRSWCALLDLSAESAPGGLLWQAASEADTLDAMCAHIEKTDAPAADKRAATNHLTLARSWEIFDPEGLSPQELASEAVTVLDVSGLDTAPMNAVVRAVGEGLYRARVDDTISRLPWLVLDEVHTFFDGVGAAALRTILTLANDFDTRARARRESRDGDPASWCRPRRCCLPVGSAGCTPPDGPQRYRRLRTRTADLHAHLARRAASNRTRRCPCRRRCH